MRKLPLMVVALFLIGFAFGQSTGSLDTKESILSDSLAEGLVALAMKNPQISSADHISQQFRYSYKRTRSQWMDNVVVAANLNEFSINQTGEIDPLKQSTQYPRWNVGVRIPVGLFINSGKESKSAMHKYKSTQDEASALKLAIRRQVLSIYEDYKLNKELIAIQREIFQDAKFLFSKTEEKFQKGEINLEDYTTASRLYNGEKLKGVSLERDLNISIAQLEELIGMNLNVATRQILTPEVKLSTRN